MRLAPATRRASGLHVANSCGLRSSVPSSTAAAGTHVRSGPLTWSQEDRWRRVFWRQHGESYPTGLYVWPVRREATVEQVRRVWNALVRRNEGLRSRFGLGAGGRPVQRVLAFDPDDVPIETAPLTGSDEDTAWLERLDPTGPLWSVRFLTEGDLVRVTVLRVEHVLYDATGINLWGRQLRELSVRPDAAAPVTQPIDLAERMPARDDPKVLRAQQRYAESLASVPQVVIPATRQDPGQPRYLCSTATFRGLGQDLDAVRRVTGGTPATVLTYVVSSLIARIARRSSLPIEMLFHNRAGGANALACQMLGIYFTAAVPADESPRLGISNLRDATIQGFIRDRLPLDLIIDARSLVSAARGVSLRPPITFNIIGVDELPTAPAPFSLTVNDTWSGWGQPCYNLIAIGRSGDSLKVALDVDAAMLTKADTAAIIEDIPVALRRLREEPERPFGAYEWSVRPFALDDGLVQIGPDWVRPQRVAEIVAAEPGVGSVSVEVEGATLSATVDGDAAVVLSTLHDRVLTALPDHSDVVAPGSYRRAGSGEVWRPGDVGVVAPCTPAEVALAEAMLRTHKVCADFSLSYAAAGGRTALGPTLAVELEKLGYTGLTSLLLASPSTMRSLAALLRPVAAPMTRLEPQQR